MEKPNENESSRRLVREVYFPTFIYYDDVPGSDQLNKAIKPHIRAWKADDPKGIVRSNVAQTGSWHSTCDVRDRPECNDLVAQILSAAQVVFDDAGYDTEFEPHIDNMWANINPRHAYNRSHVHPNVLWSGVYYVQATRDSGRIFFTDPRAQAQMLSPRYRPNEPRKRESWSEVHFQPTEGRLLIFPAWLLHEVEPNLSEQEGPDGERISVSFNLSQTRRNATTER